jgi:UDPglucose 6-dehydrogenase
MAKLGHDVIGIDVDEGKIDSLNAGRQPFFEPELEEILAGSLSTGRLAFSTDPAAIAGATVHFIAVGTPQRADGIAADLSYVEQAITAIVPHLNPGDLVVGKSTVPVGTARRLAARLEAEAPGAILAWNPEFLREGFAVADTISPDRLVYGVGEDESGERAVAILNELYGSAVASGTPVVTTNYETAELVKSAANAFLATKISFINAMAEIAEVTGADVTQLADAIGYDNRIGRRFLNAGVGFGGGCLPKDIRAFSARAQELGRGESVAFLHEVDQINLRRRARVVQVTQDELGGRVIDKKVVILGLAFKPQSDDVRDSPALDVAVRLNGLGARVVATDPEAISNSRRVYPQLTYEPDTSAALRDADAVVLVTEWEEYRRLDPAQIATLVRTPLIVDARNCLTPESWRAAGWTYRGLGRS